MSIDLVFKIAGVGIVTSVLHQMLISTKRDEMAMFVSLGGLIVILLMIINEISYLFETIKTIFNL